MAKEMTNYQQRMTSFVYTMNIYGAVMAIVLFWKDAPGTSWVVYRSTVALVRCIAVGCDAVYDSLTEQLPPRRDF